MIEFIKKRPTFIFLTQRGLFLPQRHLIIQYLPTTEPPKEKGSSQEKEYDNLTSAPQLRVGFTASKKVGNAVLRNKAKRRMRALVHDYTHTLLHDHQGFIVLIATPRTPHAPWQKLQQDFETALKQAKKSSHRKMPEQNSLSRSQHSSSLT